MLVQSVIHLIGTVASNDIVFWRILWQYRGIVPIDRARVAPLNSMLCLIYPACDVNVSFVLFWLSIKSHIFISPLHHLGKYKILTVRKFEHPSGLKPTG